LTGYGSSAAPLVTVEGVTRRFGELTAVGRLSLTVEAGTVVGLIGSDGAGKSTLLRMMATMLPPTEGRITIAGMDVTTRKDLIKPLIGYMPQRFGLYEDLTVDENLRFFMDVFDIPPADRPRRREKYLGFSNLLPFHDRPAGALSGGMKQKLALACVLVHEPSLLILDEPTNGVDPVSRREFWEILLSRRREGMTIVVSTAYLDEGSLCDTVVLMHRGEILAWDTPEAVKGPHGDLEEAMIARIEAADPRTAGESFLRTGGVPGR